MTSTTKVRSIVVTGALVLMVALAGCGPNTDRSESSDPARPQAGSETRTGVLSDTEAITGTGENGTSTDIGGSGPGSGEGSGGTNFGGTPLPTAIGQPTTSITSTQLPGLTATP